MVDEIVGRIWTTLRAKPYIALGIVAALVLGALLVLFNLADPADPEGGSAGAEAETVSSEPVVRAAGDLSSGSVTVDVEVISTSPTRDDYEFAAALDWDPQAAEASGEVDMSTVINDSGIFGEHEGVATAFEGSSGTFDVVPEDRWLSVDLESGSPRVGADIAALRDALLVNPSLLNGLFDGVPAEVERTGSTYSYSVSVHGSHEDEVFAEAAAALRRHWTVDNIPVKVTLSDDDSIEAVEVVYSYPVVPGAQDNVEVTITYAFAPASGGVTLPDDKDVVTYEDLSS